MGGATNITTDKIGTLTQNRMTVVKGYFGRKFHDEVKSFVELCQGEQRDLLNEHIAVNSTAFIQRKEGAPPEFVGSKTECALLMLSEELQGDYEALRNDTKDRIVHMYPFSSAKKSSAIVLAKSGAAASDTSDASSGKKSKKSKKEKAKASASSNAGGFLFYCKGASEIVLGMCDRIVDADGKVTAFDKKTREKAEQMIIDMASQGLRTLCLVKKTFIFFSL